ncbi:LytR C-terminal domain-containing protein, partial [Streptomyces sp. NPDC001165]|uniref:LytR C-terminal domain-containing protein n=1 Tax=Streptomyces sp. NPDC001165 TaxID=3364546 RepID=UPI00368E77E7
AASATAKTPTVPKSEIAVTVENGTTVTGRASAVAAALTGQGFSPDTTTANAPSPATTTTLTYGTGHKGEAQTAAKALGLSAAHLKKDTAGSSGLTLVIGSDWPSGTSYPGGATSSAPADTKAAVSNAHAQTADQARTCAKVSPYKTVELGGVPMTPAQAYAAARTKPDSDD